MEGEILNFNKPFMVNVSVEGKAMGRGMQDVLICFEDESAVQITVSYVYLPLPTCSPTNLLFKQDEMEKTLCLTFPQESDVILGDMPPLPFLTFSQTTESQDGTSMIRIKCVLDRSKLENEKDGNIRITSSSERKPEFVIPYLVLSH
ncbi:MAG: hypothetical protein LBU65_04945 [Planctomycetaceae bacterium]|jgi:hypothetical protein|nr:hypothetical protein [Planctomycetaceae bacterium]